MATFCTSQTNYCPKTPMYWIPPSPRGKRKADLPKSSKKYYRMQNIRIVWEEMETGTANQIGWRAIIAQSAVQHRQIRMDNS